MNFLATIFEKLEESMVAATFAEAGEFELARQFFTPQKKTHKRVLLGTDRMEINPKTLTYAMRLCQCIGGSLEIFHAVPVPEDHAGKIMASREDMLVTVQGLMREKGIEYQFVEGGGCLAEEVLKYTGNRRDLLCVIFDALGVGSSGCQKVKEAMLARFHALHCPVVVYAEQSMA